jgi:nucleoid DNA-binding protein
MANGKPSTKTEIYSNLADQTGLKKKDIASVFDALAGMMQTDLKKVGVFNVPGLMKVKVVHKPAVPEREGVNPFTGEKMMFKAKPARNTVKVTALKGLKEMV